MAKFRLKFMALLLLNFLPVFAFGGLLYFLCASLEHPECDLGFETRHAYELAICAVGSMLSNINLYVYVMKNFKNGK